jgi:hypothetical protein
VHNAVVLTVVILAFGAGASWAADDDITFAPKNFIDLGDESVGISGTLVGDDLAYKNNTRSLFCIKERKECYATAVEQIGPNLIGRLDYVMIYPITRWNAQEIVASEDVGEFGCSKTTITITRKSQNALWVEEPVNQSRPQCQKLRQGPQVYDSRFAWVAADEREEVETRKGLAQ